MKKGIALVLLLCLLTGCAPAPGSPQRQFTATFLDLFDTVTTVKGYADSQEEFTEKAQAVREDLAVYHRLFDIYNSYDGLNNLKTVNDCAGIAAVPVDGSIIALLKDCRSYYTLTGGRVNAAMGSVLQLWHEARQSSLNDPAGAYAPDAVLLADAALHTDFGNVIIDEAAGTVYLADPRLRLDVGAVAKGWAAQQVAQRAPEGLLISVGGNVCATGPKEDGTPWVIGVQDPRSESYLHTLYLEQGSVVTSGDYQRVFSVGDVAYHHIIDPETCQPSRYWSSVTVLCEDSALADALSTALFLLPLEEGQALLTQCGAEALWVDPQGTLFYSPGFKARIRT